VVRSVVTMTTLLLHIATCLRCEHVDLRNDPSRSKKGWISSSCIQELVMKTILERYHVKVYLTKHNPLSFQQRAANQFSKGIS
jgi:hypothetical protein